MIDAAMLSAGLHIPRERAEHWTDFLNEAMEEFGIDSALRQAAFLAQCAHESQFLTQWVENLTYSSADRIRAVFGVKRFPTVNSAQMFVRNPKALAIAVYSGRLGNGDASTCEGWRFRGRGLLQITGRTNYERASEGLEEDFIADPDLLAREDHAALVSGWWWADNGCNSAADSGDIDAVTRIVNGPAMIGRAERERIFRDFLDVLVT